MLLQNNLLFMSDLKALENYFAALLEVFCYFAKLINFIGCKINTKKYFQIKIYGIN